MLVVFSVQFKKKKNNNNLFLQSDTADFFTLHMFLDLYMFLFLFLFVCFLAQCFDDDDGGGETNKCELRMRSSCTAQLKVPGADRAGTVKHGARIFTTPDVFVVI